MRALLPAMLGLLLLVPMVPAVPPESPWWEQPLGIPEPEPRLVTSGPVVALPLLPGDDVLVPVDRNQNEYSIAINPRNPDNLVAGANDYSRGDAWAGFYTSLDGGATWAHGYIPLPAIYTVSGDPTIAADKDGNFYYAGIAFNRGSTNGGANAIFVSKSTDGGRTWATLTPFTSPSGSPFHDKPYIGTDPNSGALLLTYTHFGNQEISFSKSINGGLTFTPRKVIGGGQFSLPVAGNNGEIYVTWAGGGAQFAVSTDGGATFTSRGGVLGLGLGSMGLPFRTFSYPVMDVARGGAHPGRIYLAGPQGDDLFLISSDDRGATWTSPERIPRDGFQLMPWMAIGPDGTVGISYMDSYRRTLPQSAMFWPSDSLDQSLSVKDPLTGLWTSMLLTDVPSRPSATRFWGDYQGLAASVRGFSPAFGDARSAPDCGLCVGESKLDFGTMRVDPLPLI